MWSRPSWTGRYTDREESRWLSESLDNTLSESVSRPTRLRGLFTKLRKGTPVSLQVVPTGPHSFVDHDRLRNSFSRGLVPVSTVLPHEIFGEPLYEVMKDESDVSDVVGRPEFSGRNE